MRGLSFAGPAFYACAMNRPVSPLPRLVSPRRTAGPATLLVGMALLAGCASTAGYPALTKGANELAAEGRITACGIPVARPAPVPVSPAVLPPQLPLPADLPARLAALADQARAANADFAARRGKASSLVGAASGSGRGSEAWSVASIALADLSSARSRTAVALADLDQLYVAQRVDGGDGIAIAAVRDQVTAWVADEDAVLADLSGRLGS